MQIIERQQKRTICGNCGQELCHCLKKTESLLLCRERDQFCGRTEPCCQLWQDRDRTGAWVPICWRSRSGSDQRTYAPRASRKGR